MHRFLLKTATLTVLLFLAGCQTSSGPAAEHSVFSFAPPPAEVNLAQSVQDALIRSGDPVMAQVHVQTNQSHVLLTGYVKKIRQSDMAEQLVRKVPGVQSVENHLIVRQ